MSKLEIFSLLVSFILPLARRGEGSSASASDLLQLKGSSTFHSSWNEILLLNERWTIQLIGSFPPVASDDGHGGVSKFDFSPCHVSGRRTDVAGRYEANSLLDSKEWVQGKVTSATVQTHERTMHYAELWKWNMNLDETSTDGFMLLFLFHFFRIIKYALVVI